MAPNLTKRNPLLYLDHAASTPICEEALNILEKSFREDFANPSAGHKLGKELSKRVQNSRKSFLNFLDARPDEEFIFTSSATESNNMVIRSSKGRVWFSSTDHPSLVMPSKNFCEDAKEIPLLKNGVIDTDKLLTELSETDDQLILCHVNNQTGITQPIDEICKTVKSTFPKIHIHVDAVQSFGKIPLSLKNGNIDSLTLSAHKINGPKGVGGLFLKKNSKIKIMLEGGRQDSQLRSSTLAAPLIFAFEEAAKNALAHLENFKNASELSFFLRERLKSAHPFLTFPWDLEDSSPYIISFMYTGISSDIVIRHLEQKDIFLSSSSACSSKIKGENTVLARLGFPLEEHKYIIRLSFGFDFNKKIAEQFLEQFAKTVQELEMFRK